VLTDLVNSQIVNLKFLDLALLGLASYRLTHLIVYDKIFEFLRRPFMKEVKEKDSEGNLEVYVEPRGTGIRHFLGELVSCYWCVGIWMSGGLVVLHLLLPAVVIKTFILFMAVAGIQSLLETFVTSR